MARLKNPSSQYLSPIFSEVLAFFEQNVVQKEEISSITIRSEKGDSIINQNGGVLQLTADILPANYSENDIEWSIELSPVEAKIDATGLLISSGNSLGNGTIAVKACSKTNNTIYDIFEVTINGQGK
jgi:hypothetical protein